MRTNTTTSFELFSKDFRLDASNHANEGSKAFRLLNKWKSTSSGSRPLDSIGDVCLPNGIYIGGRAKRIYVDDPKHGIPFLSSSDMLLPSIDGVKLISNNQPELDSILLHPGWTLISRSGTIGNTAYTRMDMDGLAGSEHIMRVIADPKKIFSGYLYAFLSSVIGVSMIRQGTFGAVIDTIEPKYIANLPIPRLDPTQEEIIHKLIEQAAELRADANLLIGNARDQLMKSSNLPKLQPNDYYFSRSVNRSSGGTGVFTVSSSALSSLTINAWNFADKFEILRQRIKQGKYHHLSEVISIDGYKTGSSYKRIPMPPGSGIEFLGQKDMFGVRKIGKWISRNPIRSIDSEEVKDGTILIAGVGTNAETEVFGRCEFVWKNFDKKLIAAEVIRIIADPNKIDSGYLYAFLSSDYGFRLLRSTITGTKLCRFIEPLVLEIPIPMVNSPYEQLDIGNMVRQAYDFRAKAIQLEDQAQALLCNFLGVSNNLSL